MTEPFRSHLCLIHMEFFFPEVHSLKEKRMILRRLKDRLTAKFNVSVAEVGYQDLWQRAVVAVVMVSGELPPLQQAVARIRQEIEENGTVEPSHFAVEYL
ncbi:MAG TPA: DUF503 domain-containing protein [Acidobacteriota bacterium]|nr:DUF503 domain-containing protein [Acidobacteriota bacterium]HQM61832.1 DUF503 domain-containing protein [Acidobacteriota bacterium]